MTKKAKSKEKRMLVCITAFEGGRNMRKRCNLLTLKEVKKVWVTFGGTGRLVGEVSRF